MLSGKPRFWLLPAVVLAGSQAEAAVPQTSPQRSLKSLSVALMDAVERKDRATLHSLVASDFGLQMPGESKVTPRDEWIANAVEMDWFDFRYENMVVRVHGDNATVSSKLRFRVSPIPFALDSGVIDSWERRGGRWQITRRYLGESRVQQRIAFGLGLLAAVAIAGMAFAIRWGVRRSRRAHP